MAGIGDFQNLINPVTGDPHFAAAWGEVSAQLTKEGTSDLTAAKIALSDTFQNLVSQSFGMTPQEAADKAKQYVLIGQTVLGAVGTVKGLIQTVESGNTQAIGNAFVGTMVGAAVAFGAVSAGVGAAIVAVASSVFAILNSIGAFGKPPTGVKMPGCEASFPSVPAWLVGCLGFYGTAISPSSTQWIRFPNPNDVDAADWYRYLPYSNHRSELYKLWRGVNVFYPGFPTMRNIDVAFPVKYNDDGSAVLDWGFAGIEKLAATTNTSSGLFAPISNALNKLHIPDDFIKAYFNAWKSNKEYLLNGWKCQPDEQVLLHTVRMWNKAHSPGTLFLIDQNQHGNYWQSLVYILERSGGDPILVNGQLPIHTGPIQSPVAATSVVASRVIAIHLAPIDHVISHAAAVVPSSQTSPAVKAILAKVMAQNATLSKPKSIVTSKLAPAKFSKLHMLTLALLGVTGFLVAGPLGAAVGSTAGHLVSKALKL
jgi:uncharacterized membrane protein